MVDPLRPFPCGDCGKGTVRLLPAADTDFLWIQRAGCTYLTAIPAHLQIPKCDQCGNNYFGYSRAIQTALLMGADPELPLG